MVFSSLCLKLHVAKMAAETRLLGTEHADRCPAVAMLVDPGQLRCLPGQEAMVQKGALLSLPLLGGLILAQGPFSLGQKWRPGLGQVS